MLQSIGQMSRSHEGLVTILTLGKHDSSYPKTCGPIAYNTRPILT